MTVLTRAGSLLAMLLVGLGIALTLKTLQQVGVDQLALGHVIGPGLVAAGIARLRLQRMLDVRAEAARAAEAAAEGAGAELVEVDARGEVHARYEVDRRGRRGGDVGGEEA